MEPVKPLKILSLLRSWVHWRKQERNFHKFLKKILSDGSDIPVQEIFIIIQPWSLTPLPWYLISLGIAFQKYGKRVRVIFDDCSPGIDGWVERFQQKSINRVLKKMPKGIKVQKLSEYNGAFEPLPSSLDLNRLVRKNKIIHYRGEVFPDDSHIFEIRTLEALKNTAGKISCLFKDHQPSYIVLGGGGYRTSGVWMEMSKENGIRVATVDSGLSILLLSTAGIAANLEDIPRAFQMLSSEDDEWIIEEAKSELKRRMTGTDQFTSQNIPATGKGFLYGVVLPLNQSYDLSALERHNVFSTQTEWILETINWVLQYSNETIAIRRHPVERFQIYRSNDDYLKSITDRFGTNERIRFIDSHEDINTYDLIMNAKVVVPYISTVGTEAAALGRVVVTEGQSCYADLGFIWTANTKEEYFDLLNKAITKELSVSKEQQNAAWKCYYLTQCRNWHRNGFTPHPVDFESWVTQDPNLLLEERETIDLLYAIDNDIPLPIVNHRNLKLSETQVIQA